MSSQPSSTSPASSDDERDGYFISQAEFERVVELKREFDAKTAELDAKVAEFKELKSEHTRLHADKERKENEMLGILSSLKEELDSTKTNLIVETKQHSDFNKKYSEKLNELQSLSRERDFLQRSLDLLKKDFAQEQELVAALNGRVKALQQEADEHKQAAAQVNLLELEQQKQLDSMRDTIQQRKIARLESELENERSINVKNLEAIEHQQAAMRRLEESMAALMDKSSAAEITHGVAASAVQYEPTSLLKTADKCDLQLQLAELQRENQRLEVAHYTFRKDFLWKCITRFSALMLFSLGGLVLSFVL